MATQKHNTTGPVQITAGDASVNGLIAGVVAGSVMIIYLLAAGLALGNGLGDTLAQFAPQTTGATANPMVGLFTHLAVSAVYGVVFALGWHWVGRKLPVPVWVSAAAYGLGLWLLASGVFLSSALPLLHAIPPLHFGLAHAIYGISLGLGLSRS
jgi:hypothetical protein